MATYWIINDYQILYRIYIDIINPHNFAYIYMIFTVYMHLHALTCFQIFLWKLDEVGWIGGFLCATGLFIIFSRCSDYALVHLILRNELGVSIVDTWIIMNLPELLNLSNYIYIYIIICIYIYRYDIDMVMIWWIHVDIMLIQSNCDPSDSKCGYIIYQYFDVLNTIYYIYIYYHFVFVCVWVCCLNCFHIEYHRIASNCHCALTKHTPILVRVNLMIW